VRLFQTLPAAMKNREEAQREDDFGIGGDYDDEEEDEGEWEQEDWDQEEEAETTDIKDESTAYLDFLSQQAAKFNSAVGEDEGDDELEEESLLETPLDQMEPYSLFKQSLESEFHCNYCKLQAILTFMQISTNGILTSTTSSQAPSVPRNHKSSKRPSRTQTKSPRKTQPSKLQPAAVIQQVGGRTAQAEALFRHVRAKQTILHP
jgi:hypothetical protein